MNMGELAAAVASTMGTSEKEAKAAVSAVVDKIAEAVARGEEVAISGFGKFTVKDRPEREGRNPATGESMTIAASKKVTFTAAKGLKDKL
jgi:DNA-binding protein HU-beta